MNKPRLVPRILVFCAAAAAAAFLIPRIRFTLDLGIDVPAIDAKDRERAEAFSRFAGSDALVISLEREGEDAAPPEELRTLAASLAEATGSPALSPFAFSEDGGAPEAAGGWRDFFISEDGRAWLAYVFFPEAADQAELLARAEAAVPLDLAGRASLWGKPVIDRLIYERTSSEMKRLIPISAAVILLVLCGLCQDILLGLLLWIAALVPGALAMGLYGALGIPFHAESMVVPIAVISLSTSYCIQAYEHAGLGKGEWESGRAGSVAGMILACGMTALIGFASVLASPISSMRAVAGMIIAGICFALASAVLFLSPALAAVKGLRGLELAPKAVYGRMGSRAWPALAALAAAAILGYGAAGLRIEGETAEDYFRRGDPIADRLADYSSRLGGGDGLEVVAVLGGEYPFVRPDIFQACLGAVRDIEALGSTVSVLDYAQVTSWAFHGLNGLARGPESIEEIGETLELLQSSSGALNLDSLIDPGYGGARFIIRYAAGDGPLGQAAYAAYRDSVLATMRAALPGASVYAGGPREDRLDIARYLARGLGIGIAALFGLLVAAIALVFKSFKKGLAAIVPALAGTLCFFGVAGFLDIPVGIAVATTVGIMGVAVDDSIHIVSIASGLMSAGIGGKEAIKRASELAGTSVVLTASVILCGFSPLLISSFKPVAEAAFLSMLSLAVAALVSLGVLPYVLRLVVRKKVSKHISAG